MLPPEGSAAPRKADAEFEAAIEPYLQLRTRDPQVMQPQAWESAASTLTEFLEVHSQDSYTPPLLFHLGHLYEQLYNSNSSQGELTRAIYFYERLVREFPEHSFVDDALLSLGDLRKNALGDQVGARAAYYEIIDRHPNGDKISQARSRLGIKEEEQPQAQVSEKPVKPQQEVPKVEARAQVKDLPPVTEAPKTELPKEAAPQEKRTVTLRSKSEGKEIYAQTVEKAIPLIVIDPGHGGEDRGAVGVDGVLEKEVVLNIAFYLEELLRERLRARTILTRARDQVVSLADRTKLANDQNADLFISIHANASPNKKLHGIETYYLDNTNDRSSLKLAERENQSLHYGQEGGGVAPDLQFILSDMIQNAKLEDSISLSHHVHSALYQHLSRYYKGVKNLGVKKAPFYVLVGAHMPCVLVEVSFIDHPVEGAYLIERTYQKLVADALYRGIRSFFEKTQRG